MTLDNKAQIAAQFTPEITKKKLEIDVLKAEILSKESETNALYETDIAEAEGRKGTKLLGKGPVYKEKREKHDATMVALPVHLRLRARTCRGQKQRRMSRTEHHRWL